MDANIAKMFALNPSSRRVPYTLDHRLAGEFEEQMTRRLSQLSFPQNARRMKTCTSG